MIDSHCHLDYEPLSSNLSQVIKRSKDVGIKKILTICTTLNSFTRIKEIVKVDEIVFGTFGIHPHETKKDKINSQRIIKEIKENKKIIGIGETGLDFFYNHSEKSDQIKSFEEHISAAIELNIPLIVHSRNAEKEILEIFQNFKNNKLKISATKKLIKKLNPILSEYSEKNSISIILQKRDIIIGKNSLNITDDIIKILDENVKEIKIN